MSAWRRIWNLVAFGTLSAVNDSGTVQTVQVQIGPDEIRDGAPNVQLFGLSGNPPVGTDVVMIFPGGDRANGVVVASNHQGSRPTGQAAGETTLFNAFRMTIMLTENGIVIDGGGKAITFQNTPSIAMGTPSSTTDLYVSGDLLHRYGSAAQIGLGTHKHKQPVDSHGDVEADTDAPTAGT